MKIIDLLNKIASGEEVPEKIRFEGKIFEKQDKTSFYCIGFGIFEQAFVLEELNKEVEIIEEDKKIEKIDVIDWNDCIHEVTHTEKKIFIEIHKTQTKLNEIIDYLMENKQ